MANKKIIGASPKVYNGISFKSLLEVSIYKTLTQAGFKVYYEPTSYTIWRGFKPTVPFYTRDSKTRQLKLSKEKLRDITYTPDFITQYKDTVVVIEAKGFANDVYPYKRKLFRKYLEDLVQETGQKVLYFEIYTKTQLLQAIEIIKQNEETK